MPTRPMIIIQRVVPHYRRELFDELHARHGCRVVTADTIPPGSHMEAIADNPPWLDRCRFIFPLRNNEYACVVPVGSILRKHKPAIVVAEGSLSMSSTYELMLRRAVFRNFALAFWFHGYNMQRGFESLSDRLNQSARFAMARRGDAAIVYGERGRDVLSAAAPGLPVFVARNTMAVDTNDGDASWLEGAVGPKRGPTLLCIGRLTALKRFSLVVDAFKQLLPRIPGARLLIAGEGPERVEIVERAGDLLGNAIFLLGPVYEPRRLTALYEAADVFVYGGSIGLAANQSIAHGVPVVIFDESAGIRHFPEAENVVHDITGWRVKTLSPDALSDALFGGLERTTMMRGEMRQQMAKYFSDKLSVKRMADGLSEAYDYLATRPVVIGG